MIAATKSGAVRGGAEDGMLAFKGIPYAEPPTGSLRFKPPVPLAPWEGVRDATAYGSRALQERREPGYVYSEDCLNLNVWTPAADGKKRPVIFFIHGGGHFEGSNSDAKSSGPRLVGRQEAVMVSVNYRLGAFGYLHLAHALGAEYAASGNCGLLDQLLALRWVRDNIAAFGGDPDQVVLMGQSAGGKSVAALMATPAAQGLFSRAIVQSGGVQCVRDRATAAALADLTLGALGIGDGGLRAEALLGMSAETLLAGQIEASRRISPAHLFGPVIDGLTMVEAPERYLASSRARGVPVLIGYARDELASEGDDAPADEADARAQLTSRFGANAAYVHERYLELLALTDARRAYGALLTQYVYANASLALAQLLAENGHQVWCYRWDFQGSRPPGHSSEMPYLFGVAAEEDAEGYLPEHAHMARLVRDTWMAFALTGDPGHPGLPSWPSCSSTGEFGYWLVLDDPPRVEPLNLQAYDKRFPMQVIRLEASGASAHAD
ncbi:carboxylesterase family protein [Cohnella ginsengisoli]|uniref:Carboxylic ester hydrolase n=1 Tax=Cohnella ginsengisoli TaxID=425004 RepID=A0A9X4KIJ3_9BACL|nr:carboxylesterase family protein [Cohnella ginsengisoli]MDG0792641.1 carboxylesterase family protein [Cohnella ginsengisoli]